MIRIGEISEEDIKLISEVFFEDKTVFVTKNAKFKVDGNTLKCLWSFNGNNKIKINTVEGELRILKIKKIATGIGYDFVDLRQVVNN